jgi:hypothetical protein
MVVAMLRLEDIMPWQTMAAARGKFPLWQLVQGLNLEVSCPRISRTLAVDQTLSRPCFQEPQELPNGDKLDANRKWGNYRKYPV